MSTYRWSYKTYRHDNRRAPSPSDENIIMSQEDLEFYDLMRTSERNGLRGFTIAELEDMGCWGHKDALPSNLSCPILSCWSKERWVDVDTSLINQDIGGNIPGKWTIENPFVWKALEPCLRLATMLMTNMKLFPFLEAMMFGRWEKVKAKDLYKPDETQKKHGGWRFRLLSGPDPLSEERWQKCMDELKYMEVDWQISLENQKWASEKAWNNGWTIVTQAWKCLRDEDEIGDADTVAKMSLSLHLIDPLMKTDGFLESERLAQQFFIALTLMHETMHAICGLTQDSRRDIPDIEGALEPFFEDEVIAEVGWTWENVVFGGVLDSLSDIQEANRWLGEGEYRTDMPYLGSKLVNFPNYHYYDRAHTGVPRLKTQLFGKGAKMTNFPVASFYMENVQQETFWTYITQLGQAALRIPKIYGMETEIGGDSWLIRGEDCIREMGDRDPASYDLPPAPLFQDELEKWQFNQSQLVKKYAITTALREQRETRREIGEDQTNLENAISAYGAKKPDLARNLLEAIPQMTPELKVPILLLSSLLPDNPYASKAQRVVKLRFHELNEAFARGSRMYPPRHIENIYSLIASILIVYGVMGPHEMKAADFRARVKRCMDGLVFPGDRSFSKGGSGKRAREEDYFVGLSPTKILR